MRDLMIKSLPLLFQVFIIYVSLIILFLFFKFKIKIFIISFIIE